MKKFRNYLGIWLLASCLSGCATGLSLGVDAARITAGIASAAYQGKDQRFIMKTNETTLDEVMKRGLEVKIVAEFPQEGITIVEYTEDEKITLFAFGPVENSKEKVLRETRIVTATSSGAYNSYKQGNKDGYYAVLRDIFAKTFSSSTTTEAAKIISPDFKQSSSRK